MRERVGRIDFSLLIRRQQLPRPANHDRPSERNDIAVTVGDSSGFVFAGERQGTVSVLPGQVAWLRWTMVAYNAGLMTLPDVQLVSVRYSTRMRVSSSCKVATELDITS
eukprot:scaffold497708_cov17-Prasinocladus_malaysianus.AAC.1